MLIENKYYEAAMHTSQRLFFFNVLLILNGEREEREIACVSFPSLCLQ